MNKSFIISTETTCDLPRAQLDALGVAYLDMHCYLDGKECDLTEFDPKNFYESIRRGAKGMTSQPNTYEYEKIFSQYLSQGKDVLHLAFSSGCSSAYINAVKTAEMLRPQFPDRKLLVLDTKAESGAQAIIVEMTAAFAESGCTAEEAYAYAESLLDKVNLYVMVGDAKYLAATGRLGNPEGMTSALLQIKPFIVNDVNGKLIARAKHLSRRVSLNAAIDKVKLLYNGLFSKIYIMHSDCPKDAAYVADRLHSIAETAIHWASPVVGSHTGPDTVLIAFTADSKDFN